ncbi:capsule assembly Wzi family protein [Mucilaginibacter robiniae]|uniref:Capsule assembly Wzi family protein n=1 Tax=Mucilaginibacter robiniae TaxID=2728022 RepID=A0A7L5E707_9SPHI|nr:gliding motility protein RemB [Mucilaginibacter robiniae]QJD97574.1 capsule assembly Wzi family protein [Mucilaginibacter robiniae]
MKKYLPYSKTARLYIVLLLLLTGSSASFAQVQYQPYSYQFYQKLNDSVYSIHTRFHSSLKPYLITDSTLYQRYNDLINYGTDTVNHHSWLHRKLFNEHLIDIRKSDYTFFADFLPDLTIGRDFSNSRTTWLNTRGYQVGGTIGKKFYFYSSGFENQGVFANYLTNYIDQLNIVPGQAYDRNQGKRTKDWSYVTALISYTPNKYLNITAGQDKNFIGDGYRSLLLSDNSSPYPFFKLTGNLGNVTYMVMWSYMQDPMASKLSFDVGYRKKWGVFHYLDWNATNRLSLGFFDAVIWADADDAGHKRGFDFSYGNPIIFLRPLEASNGSPDNAFLGFNGKYKISDQITAYGQFALDEFEAKNFFSGKGSSRNKYGLQVGVRGANVFGIKNLNYLAEFNEASPYTYSQTSSIINYAQQNEPLAHPWGANFKEAVGLLNYSYKRFDFSGEFDYGYYGLDVNNMNYGKDVFLDYRTQARYTGPFDPTLFNNAYATNGNYIGQGLTTHMYYAEGKVAYLLNPKYNLRIELGALYRRETNTSFTDNTRMLTIGVRSSFRNLYQDLASYRTH